MVTVGMSVTLQHPNETFYNIYILTKGSLFTHFSEILQTLTTLHLFPCFFQSLSVHLKVTIISVNYHHLFNLLCSCVTWVLWPLWPSLLRTSVPVLLYQPPEGISFTIWCALMWLITTIQGAVIGQLLCPSHSNYHYTQQLVINYVEWLDESSQLNDTGLK